MAAMQQPSSTPTHQSNTTTKQSSTLIMEKLKTSIIERLTKLQPNNTLSPSLIHSIQLQLQHAFPSFHIPTHPTYSAMIEKAIEELNEEDGSSEEAISEYILANYEGLPWAHKRFLSYYLDKLCKSDEVVCISSNRYSVPRLMDKFSREKKRLGLRSQTIRKVYTSEVDNLDGNEENVNVALFQEDGEEAEVLFKCRVKRKRRSSLVVQDDEEEVVGGTGSVERQDDVVENSEVPINDDGRVSDGRVEAKTKDDMNEEHQIAAGDKVQSVVAVERGSQSALSKNLEDEVKAGESSLARDPCEGKYELLVSTLDKTLPGEQEDEVRTETLLSDHAISGSNVMLVPYVSIEKSTNEPMDGDPDVVLVSGVDFAEDTSIKLVLERKDLDSCAADLKIVAVEKGTPTCLEKREIVCCLHVPQPEQPKMRHAYHPRKKLKHCQEGKPATSATPTGFLNFTKGAKLVDNGELRESTRAPDMKVDPKFSESTMLPNMMISVVEGSVELEHGKQKLHSDSFPSGHQSELMSMEDGDLNIPLKQVLKMHCKRRKSSMHANVSKMAARSEDPEEKFPQKGKKPTRRKRKQQVLQYDGQKSCSSAAVVALETLHIIQGEGQPGHELGENKQIKGGHALFHKPGQYDDINPRESSQAEDQNALKDLKHPTEHHRQQERPSESAIDLILEEADSMVSPVFLEKTPEKENDGGIANPPLESPSVKSSLPSHRDLEEDLLKKNGSDVQLQGSVPDLVISLKGKMPRSNQQSPQKEKEVKMTKLRGRPSKNKNENQDGAESVNSHSLKQEGLSDTVSYQQLEEQSKSAFSQYLEASEEDVAASVSLNARQQALSESGIHQKSDRITIGEQIDATRGLSLNLHDQWKEWPLEPATCKVKKKDGRGRPRKIKETTIKDVPAPLDLYVMRQKELAQAVICQSENKDEGENSRRQTEPVTPDVGAVDLHDWQREGVLLPVNHFLEKKDKQGVPKDEHDSTREDVTVLGNLHPQKKKMSFKTTNFQPKGRGKRRKQEVMQCEPATAVDEVAVQSTHDQQQESSSVQATHQMKDGQMKKDGQGRPPKLKLAEKSPLDLDLQQQELPFRSAIHLSPDASNVFCQPDERKGLQQNVSCPVDKLPAMLKGPISLRTRSKHGGTHKPEAAELFGFQADHLGEELVPVLPGEESHQQEVVPKTDQEKKQGQSSSENPGDSQAEVHKAPSKSEVTIISDDVTLLVDQPCKQEEEQRWNPIQKQGQQLKNHTTVPEQKSHNHIPPSAIRRSSRINQQSQIGSICTKFFLSY